VSALPVEAVCSRQFHAFHSSGTRPLGDVRWIVLHDEEAPTALSAARYFTLPVSGGSAHLCVDDGICYRCLDNEQVPWGAASAPQISANSRGFHIEQAGYARWSAVVWAQHRQTLRRAAYKTALHCRLFGIPPVWVDADAIASRLAGGVTTHAEISKASRRLDPGNAARYSHSDPGPFWPRRTFMGYVRAYYETLRKGQT
jgi:hypothetical protein